MTDRIAPTPLPRAVAARAVASYVAGSARLLAAHRVRQPRTHVDRVLTFADGSRARVYRETIVVDAPREARCTLFVRFTLRWVRGVGHAAFRIESELNTPLFVGFPGFVSKLWCAHDAAGRYRGVYEWSRPERAEWYARCLWRVLELVSVPGSIDFVVVPGLRRDSALGDPRLLDASWPHEPAAWWRVVGVTPLP
ncbi:MAG TPA: hypothetical protein VH986_09760 [Acidimicrobiia bacterium]|jgi:hypothetical protein